MTKHKFSASFDGGNGNQTPRKKREKNIVAKFNQEHEDKIRNASRKIVDFAIELKEDNIKAQAFGLIIQDRRLRDFFELTDEEVNLHKAFMEFKIKDWESNQANIADIFSYKKLSIIDKKEYENPETNQKYVRLLIDIKQL